MLLTVYLLFFALALSLVILAYFTGDTFHAFIGLLVFFYLGVVLFTGGLQVPGGYSELTIYDYTNTTLTNTTLTNTPVYVAVSDTYTNIIGIFLAIAAGFGMGLLLARGKLNGGRDE
jgi:hypothetical protein